MTGASKPQKPRGKIYRWLELNAMPGLTPKTFFKMYSLWPMHFFIVTGVVWAAIFSTRTLLFNPDSTFLRRDGFERYRDKEFKFFNFSGVVLPCKAPIYRREGDPDDDSYALPEY